MTLILPEPRIVDPAMVPILNWGLIGTGIAGDFALAVRRHSRQRIVAVTARDHAKTHAFAAQHGIETVHSNVEALVNEPSLDVIYVATPHPMHREQALAAIAAGKHVLIEKPIAMSAAEAREITSAGSAAGVLVMEAMWTRYLPHADVIRRILADGMIGDVHLVSADFGFAMPYDPRHRLWSPDLGGGALLDAGIYPISFASSIIGSPERIMVEGTRGPDCIDVSADLLLSTAGARAVLSTSIVTELPTVACISGTEGRIEIGTPFFGAARVTVKRGPHWNSKTAKFADSRIKPRRDGLGVQVNAVAAYVSEGRTESPLTFLGAELTATLIELATASASTSTAPTILPLVLSSPNRVPAHRESFGHRIDEATGTLRACTDTS